MSQASYVCAYVVYLEFCTEDPLRVSAAAKRLKEVSSTPIRLCNLAARTGECDHADQLNK